MNRIAALALGGILAVAEANTPQCPDCKRMKARSADDCAKGLCPKWWVVRDPEAKADCESFAREAIALKERHDALRTLDLDWARQQVPNGPTGEMISSMGLLCGLHKARYECAHIEPALRHLSRAWLCKRGFPRMNGVAWPKGNELPAYEGQVL